MDESFPQFRRRLELEVLTHPAVTANAYTEWFSSGEFSATQARAFLVQFSVFSNQFLIAQLQKLLNAATLVEMRASKEILANEIGVGFRNAGSATDPVLGSTDGSIEGGTFHFRAAHFELLAKMATQFDLSFDQLGKRRFGTPATLHFCDELARLYAHEDDAIAAAASWAVENWAAAGFWDQLVDGWRRHGQRCGMRALDMAFFTWHARLEANHARHTWHELESFFTERTVDADAFVHYAREMLDGVDAFWRGLDDQRRALEQGVAHVGIH